LHVGFGSKFCANAGNTALTAHSTAIFKAILCIRIPFSPRKNFPARFASGGTYLYIKSLEVGGKTSGAILPDYSGWGKSSSPDGTTLQRGLIKLLKANSILLSVPPLREIRLMMYRCLH
jgi:hypothetical protein